MFTIACEHCVNTSRRQRVAEAAAGELRRGDELALDKRFDHPAKGVRVDVQVAEELTVVERASAVVAR